MQWHQKTHSLLGEKKYDTCPAVVAQWLKNYTEKDKYQSKFCWCRTIPSGLGMGGVEEVRGGEPFELINDTISISLGQDVQTSKSISSVYI